jgi:hypothetical protein
MRTACASATGRAAALVVTILQRHGARLDQRETGDPQDHSVPKCPKLGALTVHVAGQLR